MRAKSDWRSTRYLAAQERSKLKRRLRNEQRKRDEEWSATLAFTTLVDPDRECPDMWDTHAAAALKAVAEWGNKNAADRAAEWAWWL